MKRSATLLLFTAIWPLRLVAGDPDTAMLFGDAEITLPVYEIVETREKTKPEPWLHGTVAGFEVLSCGTESQTRKLVHELQRFQIALGAVWPEAMRHSGAPISIILCGRKNTFDAFASYGSAGRYSGSATASRVLFDKERAVLVVNLTDRTGEIYDPINAGARSMSEREINHYDELIHAYVRYLVHRPNPPPPAWLAEGLTQIIANISYDRWAVEFGKLNLSQYGCIGPAGLIMMPMEQFLSVQEDSPASRALLWQAQAYAFVHRGIYGERGRFQKGFFKFVTRLQTEPLSEALFTECFSMNYAKFGSALRRYTASAWYDTVRARLKRGYQFAAPEYLGLRAATPAEIARIRADGLLLARGADTAFLALIDAYNAGERDPALLASLGNIEVSRHNEANARAFFEVATRAGVDRPRAYTELARLRLASFGVGSEPTEVRLTRAQLAQVLRPLFAARDIRPAVPDTYALIARAWEVSATPPRQDHLAVLLEGSAHFPWDIDTLLRAARLHQQAGLEREAGALARLGRIWSPTPMWVGKFREIEQELPSECLVDLIALSRPVEQPPAKPVR